MNKEKRTRNWAMIVYPESAPENWKEIIGELHVPWICSPLHDKDVYLKDGEGHKKGEFKKPHWHVILVYENMKAFHQIKEITEKLNAPNPQACESLRGYIRYLVHTDNPEKYQYNREDIENHGVDDIDKYFETASSDREILKEIVEYIRDNNITRFGDLAYYAIATGNNSWFDVISKRNSYFLKAVCDSEFQRAKADDEDKREGLKETRNINKLNQEKPAEKMERAMKIRNMLSKGFTRKQIADTLGISERTVRRLILGK